MKNYIKKHREKMGLSQGDLANTLDVSRQTINSIENGKFDPSLGLVFKLIDALGTPLEEIFIND